jgi:hypothetical protein
MACQCDFFSMKSRQHVSLPLCQRIELILKGWKDSALVLSQTAPDSTHYRASVRSLPVCSREWLLLIMLRLVATHHVVRFMTSSLEVNYHDTRFSRETPEGQARFMKLQQCSHTLKNVAAVPAHDIFSILTTYTPALPELVALHGQSMSDAVNHPALALLHRDVSELLTSAMDLAAKPNAQPSNLQSDIQALVKRKLRMRPSTSSSTNGSSPAVAMAANAAGGSGTAGADPAAAAAAPVTVEPESGNRSVSSPPPASASSTASSTMRDDSPEFVSACLRCAACSAAPPRVS